MIIAFCAPFLLFGALGLAAKEPWLILGGMVFGAVVSIIELVVKAQRKARRADAAKPVTRSLTAAAPEPVFVDNSRPVDAGGFDWARLKALGRTGRGD